MNRIRMIAFDLDGTLLTTEKRVTDRTVKVLERAAAQGIRVVPSTGRPFTGVMPEILSLPGVRYVITSNGARIVDIKDGSVIYRKLLPYKKAEEILDIFKDYDTMRDVYYDGQGYTEKRWLDSVERFVPLPSMANYIRTTRIGVEDLDEKFHSEGRDVDKVQGLFADTAEKREAMERVKALGGLTATGALANNIEVNAEGVHKGAALLMLGKRLGIRQEEILAFGDGANDEGMLRDAGTGVAMSNAVPEVKAAADYVTASNDEDGVAVFIERYLWG